MDARQGRWSAMTLELVPLDAAPAPATSCPAPTLAPVPDADAIRDAYLRARFPGVIHALADLGDANQVIDAARCYAEDGRIDRAQELMALALTRHPDMKAPRKAPQEGVSPVDDAMADRTAARHAAQIHRFLVAEAAARTRLH